MLQEMTGSGRGGAVHRAVRLLNRLGPAGGTVMVAGDATGLDRRFAVRTAHPAAVEETLESLEDGALTGVVLPRFSAGDARLHRLVSLLGHKLEPDGIAVASLRHYRRGQIRRDVDGLARRCGLETRFLTRLWPPASFVLIQAVRWEIF